MARIVTKEDCLAELKRFFRYYSFYCQSPDPDAVREVIASIYSVNDKVRRAGYSNFFDSDEFLTIKAIRNYAIHQAEIYNKAKAFPMISKVPIKTELLILCLLPREVIDLICEATDLKGRSAITNTCIYYKKYVDIYPCIFNFGVQLFLYTEKNNLQVNSREYQEFKNSIDYERSHNYPHHVIGGVSFPHGEDVDEFIESSLHSINEKNELQNTLFSEENGMFTFKGLN